MSDITLTAAAAEQMRSYIADDAVGIRLALRKAGCSGFMYHVEVEKAVTDKDEVFTSHGIKLIVARTDIPMLLGSSIDFREQGLSSTFHFDNPNAVAQCGCGESFTVADEAKLEEAS